jgi:hypothetical protein
MEVMSETSKDSFGNLPPSCSVIGNRNSDKIISEQTSADALV